MLVVKIILEQCRKMPYRTYIKALIVARTSGKVGLNVVVVDQHEHTSLKSQILD